MNLNSRKTFPLRTDSQDLAQLPCAPSANLMDIHGSFTIFLIISVALQIHPHNSFCIFLVISFVLTSYNFMFSVILWNILFWKFFSNISMKYFLLKNHLEIEIFRFEKSFRILRTDYPKAQPKHGCLINIGVTIYGVTVEPWTLPTKNPNHLDLLFSFTIPT